jgi:hypothetical protein
MNSSPRQFNRHVDEQANTLPDPADRLHRRRCHYQASVLQSRAHQPPRQDSTSLSCRVRKCRRDFQACKRRLRSPEQRHEAQRLRSQPPRDMGIEHAVPASTPSTLQASTHTKPFYEPPETARRSPNPTSTASTATAHPSLHRRQPPVYLWQKSVRSVILRARERHARAHYIGLFELRRVELFHCHSEKNHATPAPITTLHRRQHEQRNHDLLRNRARQRRHMGQISQGRTLHVEAPTWVATMRRIQYLSRKPHRVRTTHHARHVFDEDGGAGVEAGVSCGLWVIGAAV